jgi:histidinol-phosphate aminotransferase
VLIDEAYHHYVGKSAFYASFLDRPLNDDRIIVSRSFSHAYGLAGMRVGYGIASSAAAKRMRALTTQDNINAIALSAAVAALQDTDSVAELVQRTADDRQEFRNQAGGRQLKPIDSHANFLMMNTFRPASTVVEHFRAHNILIGPVFPAMNTHIRVSLGQPAEMEAFWRVWDLLPHVEMEMQH